MKPTETQVKVLRGIQRGGGPFAGARGRSEHGGRARALDSVANRGWASYEPAQGGHWHGGWSLTDDGRKVLRAADQAPERARLEALFRPASGGNCEAGRITPGYVHRARARYEGPMTENGGNLWCGGCRKRYIEERLSR